MASFEEIRKGRIDKMNVLLNKGVNPYPARTAREYSLNQAIENFDELAKKESVILAGRVMAIRGQGGLVFFNINDGTGSIQGLFKKDEMDGEIFDLFTNTSDLGDFVEITGPLFITKIGEKTLQV